MAPHPCELNMKTILTDKGFNPQSFLKSGFHQFLENVVEYLREFNKIQDTGFFKKAKYVDAKSLNMCMRKIFQYVAPGSIRQEDIQLLDKIFGTLLHPKTPAVYYIEALENYLNLISVLNDQSLDDLQLSLPLIVPYLIVAKYEDQSLTNAKIYANSNPIIDPQSPGLTAPDASKSLEMVFDFLFKNWTIREGLSLNLFFNCIVKIIYKALCEKNSVATYDYGFTVLPTELHRCVMLFLKKILDNLKPLDALLFTRDHIIMMLSICKATTYNPCTGDLIVTFNLLSSIYEKDSTYQLCINSYDKFQLSIGDLIFEVLSSNCKNNGIIEEPLIIASYDIISKYLFSMISKEEFNNCKTALSKIFVSHENEEGAFAHFVHCTLHYLVSTQERREEIWLFFCKEFCRRPIGSATIVLYAQYLVFYSIPVIYNFGQDAITHCKNFVVRNKRNRQNTIYDFIAENLQAIFDSPNDFVCQKLNQLLPELQEFEKILVNMYIQPLSLPEDKVLETIVFFSKQFKFYQGLYPSERLLAFAPIMAMADCLARSLLFPPGIEINGTIPFQICGNALFSAIFDIDDDRIRTISFNLLAQILNINQMKNYLNEKSLSMWYAATCLQMLSTDENTREEGFKQALNIVQHAFTGSLLLVPVMMTLIESSFIKTSSQELSFLTSFPLFHVTATFSEPFNKSVLSIVHRCPTMFISDPEQKLLRSPENLRERSIKLIDRMHMLAMKENPNMQNSLFELLIPAYGTLISDELTNENPDLNLISRYLQYFVDALKLRSLESLVSIRSLLMFMTKIASLNPKVVKTFIGNVSKYCCQLTSSDTETWVFHVVRLTVDCYVETSAVMKTDSEYTDFVMFLNKGMQRSSGFTQDVSSFMRNCIDYLSKYYCKYPFHETVEIMSNTSSFKKDHENSKFFSLDGIITGTAIEGEKVKVSSQTCSGQFVWDFEPIYHNILPLEQVPQISGTFCNGGKKEIIPTYNIEHQKTFVDTMDEVIKRLDHDFKDNFNFDEIPSDGNFETILSNIELAAKKFKDSVYADKVARYSRPPISFVNPVASVFVATGRCSTSNMDHLKVIDTSEKIALDTLEKVNTHATRLGTKFGVLFVHDKAVDQNMILSTTFEETTPHFSEFITGIGWPISLKDHKGYLGGLDAKNARTGRTSIYYADSMHEMMFHVAPLLPNDPTENDNQQIYKKRHIGNDHVHIIYCTSEKDYNTTTITSQFNQVHIVVYPLQTGTFRVDTFSRNDEIKFGPLKNSVVVSKKELPSLVRDTAEEAMVRFYMSQSALAHPINEINSHIDTINERNLIVRDKYPVHQPFIEMMLQD